MAELVRKGEYGNSTQAVTGDDRTDQAQLLDKPGEIARVIVGRVGGRAHPLTIAVAALVEREEPELSIVD